MGLEIRFVVMLLNKIDVSEDQAVKYAWDNGVLDPPMKGRQ